MKDNDLISRKAAMDLFRDDVAAVNELNNLPSVQPETILCKDCRHFRPVSANGKPVPWGFCNSPARWEALLGDIDGVERIATDRDDHCKHAERRRDGEG